MQALSNLTLSDLERSKSRSLRFSVVGDLYGIHMTYLLAVILPPESGCHKREFVGGQGFPLAQQSCLFVVIFSVTYICHFSWIYTKVFTVPD